MKKIIIYVIGAFIAGFIIAILCVKPRYSMNSAKMIGLQSENVDSIQVSLNNYAQVVERHHLDQELQICRQMQSLYRKCKIIEDQIMEDNIQRRSIEELNNTITDCCNAIQKPDIIQPCHDIILSVLSDKSDKSGQMNKLLSIENIILQNYLTYIYKESVTLSYAELINVASRDTIKLGDTYSSQLLFTATDIANNKDYYEIIDDTTMNSLHLNLSRFVEKPTIKGHYHHNIMLMYTGFYIDRGWQTSIDYYVK